ncbi:small, acid-soluble spore protein L [Heyndrickxia camelliae]|uniref:Small, acid-soluble spore protein L n=1 Tax=Heyndrickxia camelliae TaxID=1707093 RepID=A0A2N3LMQ2_9BACI|nr:small, acid-soluble spore protein L [Heyndrickxia camelliae]PKR85855.1 small, acid-soluble spore protein L [Heyndrickxia camelliae]
MEVREVTKKNNNRGTKAPGVTPQGYGQDTEFAANDPKSKLENAAKKSNTK